MYSTILSVDREFIYSEADGVGMKSRFHVIQYYYIKGKTEQRFCGGLQMDNLDPNLRV